MLTHPARGHSRLALYTGNGRLLATRVATNADSYPTAVAGAVTTGGCEVLIVAEGSIPGGGESLSRVAAAFRSDSNSNLLSRRARGWQAQLW